MRWLFVFTFILTFFSCRKDNTNIVCDTIVKTMGLTDTIYSSGYLAAYPGSWWEYDDEVIECSHWLKIPIFSSSNDEGGCLMVEKEYQIIPWLIDSSGAEYGIIGNDKIYEDSVNYDQKRSTIVGEYGDSWKEYSEWMSYEYNDDVQTRKGWSCDSTFLTKTINGVTYNDVIYVQLKVEIYHTRWGGGPITINDYYFAKNIGLVKYKCFSEHWGWDYERNLTDYYIAPH